MKVTMKMIIDLELVSIIGTCGGLNITHVSQEKINGFNNNAVSH